MNPQDSQAVHQCPTIWVLNIMSPVYRCNSVRLIVLLGHIMIKMKIVPALSRIGEASFCLRLLLLSAQDQPDRNVCL